MIEKILVGTPASGESPAALHEAARLATSYDAELVVLELEPVIDARRVFDPDGTPESVSPVIPLRARYPGLRVRSQRAKGDAARSVRAAAETERPDMIVVPHGRRTGAGAAMSRRASTALIGQVPCPVLLVAS